MNYREALGDMTNEAWGYAVSVARRGWFPTIAQLEQYASEAPQPKRTAAAGEIAEESTLTPDEARAAARVGLAMVEEVLASRGIRIRRIAKPMSPEDQDARREFLRAQAAELAGKVS